MQMYPGAGYKEHRYKVDTEDYIFKDDLLFDKNPVMHGKMADHHHNYGRPNMHPMLRPIDPCKPNNHMHGNYGWAYPGNKHGGPNYSEPIYEQEEIKLHVDRYEHFRHGDKHNFFGRLNHKNHEGGYEGRAMWDPKGIDD